jgi:hypothetical protein
MIIIIETWNEFHEGTDIAESKEYGRKYIEITTEFVDKFKNGVLPENFSGEEFMEKQEISINFKDDVEKMGIKYVAHADGLNKVIMFKDGSYLCPEDTEHGGKYMYFQINPYFKLGKEDVDYILSVEYYDDKFKRFRIHYDSTDKSATLNGAYKSTKTVYSKGTQEDQVAEFILKDAKFKGSQNSGADFRIEATNNELYIKSITLEVRE